VTPEPEAPTEQRQPQHEPDYVMRGFAVRTFHPDGSLRSEVRGAEARHYPDTDHTEIDDARIRSLRPDGTLTTGQARLVTSNADQTEFELRRQAVVVREPHAGRPRMEFQGEQLQVWVNQHRVTSSQPVLLLRGRDRMRADRLDYRDDTGVANLNGRVQAVLGVR
jgi:lipopolysaccharide export system protein LptC